MFYYSTNSVYSNLAHTQKTAQLPREMMNIIESSVTSSDLQKAQQRAYVDGWWSHFAADIKGHRDYVNTFDSSLHTDVEIGVDANLAKVTSDYSLSVPYGLVQAAYAKVYGTAPSATSIWSAARSQQTAIYFERMAIALGLFNAQKATYNDFWDQYLSSISDSENAINNPPTQDFNLNTGLPILYPEIAG